MEDVSPIAQHSSRAHVMDAVPPSTGENFSHEPPLELAPVTAEQQALNASSQSFNTNQSQIPTSMQISQPTNHQIRSAHDLNVSVLATLRAAALEIPEPNRVTQAEGLGDSRLFTQLSLLDRADW
jgi:hypothetical protein